MTEKKSNKRAYTNEDGSPHKPWSDKDAIVEAEYFPMGRPLGEMIAPRDMEANEITTEDVAGERFYLKGEQSVTMKPHIAELLTSGYSVAMLLLAKQEKALRDGDEFEPSDIAGYSKIVDAVTKLSREERALEATAEVREMSDEELDAYIDEQVSKGLLGPGKGE